MIVLLSSDTIDCVIRREFRIISRVVLDPDFLG